MTDTSHPIACLTTMARHAGACEAMLAACRLLRQNGYGDAATLLIERLEQIVATVAGGELRT